MAPTENTSARWVDLVAVDLLRRHVVHGAEHQAALREVRALRWAMPKSMILTSPSGVTRMFAGFTSRWTMPWRCAYESPSHTWRSTSSFHSSDSGSLFWMIFSRSVPSMYSIAMYGRPLSSPRS
jgi:hypothetical protein